MELSYNPFSLQNKTVLITGASSGIGRATAIECSRMGARVCLWGRNEQRLEETFSLLDGEGHSFHVVDITNEEEVVRIVDQLPLLDGCVNNAGITKLQMTQFIVKSDFQNIIDTNLIASVIITRQLLKKKKIKSGGSIVFTSSVAGNFRASVGNGMYAASKAALSAFMRNVAIELAPRNIRCNSVNPAMVHTNILSVDFEKDEQAKIDMQTYPLKRYGKPEEIAYAIVYLLSDASAWTTGASLVIDGGKSIQ